MEFEWNNSKERSNQKKHGIGFHEAKSVFFDQFALFTHDQEHSDLEDRFLLLGFSTDLNLLVVVHCYKEADDIVRLISARKASKKESIQYRRHRDAKGI